MTTRLFVVVARSSAAQPGEGGPVEDWVNVEKLYEASVAAAAAAPPPAADADAAEAAKFPADRAGAGGPTLVVVNGALDKIRNGYYPKIFFPEIAGVMERFYSRMEPVYYLKARPGSAAGTRLAWTVTRYSFRSRSRLPRAPPPRNGGKQRGARDRR